MKSNITTVLMYNNLICIVLLVVTFNYIKRFHWNLKGGCACRTIFRWGEQEHVCCKFICVGSTWLKTKYDNITLLNLISKIYYVEHFTFSGHALPSVNKIKIIKRFYVYKFVRSQFFFVLNHIVYLVWQHFRYRRMYINLHYNETFFPWSTFRMRKMVRSLQVPQVIF